MAQAAAAYTAVIRYIRRFCVEATPYHNLTAVIVQSVYPEGAHQCGCIQHVKLNFHILSHGSSCSCVHSSYPLHTAILLRSHAISYPYSRYCTRDIPSGPPSLSIHPTCETQFPHSLSWLKLQLRTQQLSATY